MKLLFPSLLCLLFATSCIKERYCVCSNGSLDLTAEITNTTEKKAKATCDNIQYTYYPNGDYTCTVKE
jgi:hypothetical protein